MVTRAPSNSVMCFSGTSYMRYCFFLWVEVGPAVPAGAGLVYRWRVSLRSISSSAFWRRRWSRVRHVTEHMRASCLTDSKDAPQTEHFWRCMVSDLPSQAFGTDKWQIKGRRLARLDGEVCAGRRLNSGEPNPPELSNDRPCPGRGVPWSQGRRECTRQNLGSTIKRATVTTDAHPERRKLVQ